MRTGAAAILAAAITAATVLSAYGQPRAGGRSPPAVNPAIVASLSPVLADWIRQSRDAAIGHGVEPVPSAVREALSGYVPEPILERARWRVGASGEMSLQQQLFRFEYSPAVTLDYVVVFQDRAAAHDAKLWAHELKHVMQYADWGIDGFAARYVADYEAVEHDAAEYRWAWMKIAGLIPAPGAAGSD